MGVKTLSKPKKNKKRRNIVSFDEEKVTKDSAVSYLSLETSDEKTERNEEINVKSSSNTNETHSRKKNKKRKQGSERNEKPNEEYNVEENLSTQIPDKKQKKNKKSGELETKPESEENEKAGQNSSTEIQSKKRKKKKKAGELNTNPDLEENEQVEQNSLTEMQSKKRKKKKKLGELNTNLDPEENEQVEQNSSTEIQSKKRKKNKESGEPEGELETKLNLEEGGTVSAEKPKAKNEISIRAQKRMKHQKLLEEKRLKAATMTQQNVLNYLSKWKHARNEWKFEKLKQIWLQQNLFDSNKIPNEFWDTAVGYFNESKGFIRNCVLRDALKIIEKAESSQEDDVDENHHLVLKRAQDIIQNLQE